MNLIDTNGMDHREINEVIRKTSGDCVLAECCGQRFIAAGMSGQDIEISGVPGNALGAYLNGSTITVRGNAQDAVGDTMNEGSIIIHGNIGDAAGYAMRGGKIFVKGNAGYRAGIHMKEYKEKKPVIVIGGRAGSFLGEYQAGGIIVVLNLTEPQKKIVGYFPLHRNARRKDVLKIRLQRHRVPQTGNCTAGRSKRNTGDPRIYF